ncbi:hypothetical protein [Streptomyces sp. NPDC058394]|uniref:hypothetical protein n=1 Tax=unclassified Streptomyces TaxID=2593676 RepID=UPI003666781A
MGATPDAAAVEYEDQTLTYAELKARATRRVKVEKTITSRTFGGVVTARAAGPPMDGRRGVWVLGHRHS